MLTLILTFSCKKGEEKFDFNGKWSWDSSDKYFSIDLFHNLDTGEITGFHSGGTNDGLRIDDVSLETGRIFHQ